MEPDSSQADAFGLERCAGSFCLRVSDVEPVLGVRQPAETESGNTRQTRYEETPPEVEPDALFGRQREPGCGPFDPLEVVDQVADLDGGSERGEVEHRE